MIKWLFIVFFLFWPTAAKAKKKGAKEEETEIIEVDWGVPFVGHPRNAYPGYVPYE